MADAVQPSQFAGRVAKLEKNVYDSVKGTIRLSLLLQDVADFCPGFSTSSLRVLDIGGGSGRFARICARHGHKVLLCDASEEMLERAAAEMRPAEAELDIELLHADFLSPDCTFSEPYDVVVMHGSAEWMADPQGAIVKALNLVRPGGYLSLLVHNRDRQLLKRGINGLLLQGERSPAGNTLTPPGAMSPGELAIILSRFRGEILLQSGIRIFYKFFRQGVSEQVLSAEEWLQQEKLYYRRLPFSALGEHTHIVWRAETA